MQIARSDIRLLHWIYRCFVRGTHIETRQQKQQNKPRKDTELDCELFWLPIHNVERGIQRTACVQCCCMPWHPRRSGHLVRPSVSLLDCRELLTHIDHTYKTWVTQTDGAIALVRQSHSWHHRHLLLRVCHDSKVFCYHLVPRDLLKNLTDSYHCRMDTLGFLLDARKSLLVAYVIRGDTPQQNGKGWSSPCGRTTWHVPVQIRTRTCENSGFLESRATL